MTRISVLLASAAFAVSATSALAADAIIYDPAPMTPVSTVYDWTGFYLGAHGGYVSTRADSDGVFGNPAFAFDEKFNGGMLGIHAGYNFIQNGPWVFGIEGDVSRTWNDNTYLSTFEIGTDWQWSARARVGYAIDRTLIFGTAGVAGTNAYIDVLGAPIKIEDSMVGWTIGAGVEHAFTDQWLVRAEYRYADYGDFEPLGLPTEIDVTEHSFRLGVSYKF